MRRGITDNRKWKPISLVFIFALSLFFGIFTFHINEVATGTSVSGHISVDTTWDLAGSPYIVMNDVVVDPGVTLTIEPGVHVRFDPSDPGPPPNHDYLSIFVEGSLVSNGRSNLRIEFTSDSPTPKTYDWWAIHVNSSGHVEISFSNISYGAFGVVVYSSNNTITDSFISKNFQGVNLFPASSGNYVANNTASDNTAGFLVIGTSSLNTIRNNSAFNSPWLISGTDADNNLVADNRLWNTSKALLFKGSSNNNTMSNNTITEASDNGIYLTGQGYDIIENNTIILEGLGVGIEIRGGTEYTVSGNMIAGCEWGLYLPLWTDQSTFTGNNISRNNQGIRAALSHFNTYSSNDFVSNAQIGLSLFNSSNNLIHHNNFINNSMQASDDRDNNSWDDGYPSGGNYWSDYSGNDFNYGPSQDILGSDGIGDTPHSISTNGTDRYPLTEPMTGGLPPREVNAYLSGMDYENVTISWNLSWNDGSRVNDVTGYEIYRSTAYDYGRIGYTLLGSTPNKTTEFIDGLFGDGDPNNYFYFVCAVNGTGDSSCSVNQAGKFTRQLADGWNLVSIPLKVVSWRVQDVFATISFGAIRYYDAFEVVDHWKEFNSLKPYNDFLTLNMSLAIWIELIVDGNFTIAGRILEAVIINLKEGWNLIGYPSLSAKKLGDVQIGGMIVGAEEFAPSAIPYHLQSIDQNDQLLPGYGYWIKVSSDSSLEFTN